MRKKYIHLTIAKVFLCLSFVVTSAFCLAQDTISVTLVGENQEGEIKFSDNENLKYIAKLDLLKANKTAFCPGDSVVIYSNFESNSYGWLKNGVVIRGAVNDSLWVSSAGDYQLVCETNNTRTHYIKSKVLSIKEATVPEAIISAYTNELCPEDSIELTDSYGGKRQWYFNGEPIPGATSSTYYATKTGAYNMTRTNMNGCTDSSDVSFFITEASADECSLSEDSFISDNIIIYPNPASTHLYVKSKKIENYSIQMTDASGKIVLSKSNIGRRIYELDITQFKAGTYFIEIKSMGDAYKIKVILD